MTPANRVVQHRPPKESKEAEMKSALRELRSENQKLKRELARMRRDYEKLQNISPAYAEVDTEPLAQAEAVSTPAILNGCPNGCGVELRRIKTSFKTIVVCPECTWRKTEGSAE